MTADDRAAVQLAAERLLTTVDMYTDDMLSEQERDIESVARFALAALPVLDAATARERELVEALEALLRHYRRHTSHRCEIDRDAAATLAAHRALASDRQP